MQHSTLTNEENKSKENDLFTGQISLLHSYKIVREKTNSLCRPLATEDYVIQSMPDVSPTKWHLAHTSWFFETFILKPYKEGYKEFHSLFSYLFNSYYFQVGPRFARAERGHLSRPTVEEVYRYRRYVDENMTDFLERIDERKLKDIAPLIELGLNHEQQHQELILTDIKHVFSLNPLDPRYAESKNPERKKIPSLNWISFDEGLYKIGYGGKGFSFDNELPVHREFLNSFNISSRLVTNGEYLEFIESGGYSTPQLWLSDGWATVEKEGWTAPLYWRKTDDKWNIFTLNGLKELNLSEPVCHVSFYEADAFAGWKGLRLPRESEWETASSAAPVEGNLLESGNFHPVAPAGENNSSQVLQQLFGDVWEWTLSPYSPYPGYKAPEGAIGEYNGKFMSNQMVLRGGSCVTPISHIRNTYRNFFPPDARWQFSGIRLAQDAQE